MRYLLDTHALIWFMNGDQNLPQHIADKIKDKRNECFISIGSIWEISIKIKLGKLELPFDKLEDFLITNAVTIIPVSFSHLRQLLLMELLHRDPFDRIIIAQGIAENLSIITRDSNFKGYPAICIW